ncbi:MAG TPA: class I SAM-dependent methyltransferase [Gallionella sp.]|nr:class I SAM-dependent methyltransferase [Gallionella sp.]
MTDNPVRGRFNAWLLAALDSYMHRKYVGIKSDLFKPAPAVVVELGPGAGANLRYLPKGTRLIAIEPNQHMHPVLQRQAQRFGIELDLRGLAGEQLDLPSESVDFVFSSLVLCTVENPEQVIAEVRRVLKPGGLFVCVEHVAAPAGSANRRLQHLIRRPWKWIFEGCDLCRDTGATLRSAGFSKVELKPLVLPTVFVPIRHQITAVCVK